MFEIIIFIIIIYTVTKNAKNTSKPTQQQPKAHVNKPVNTVQKNNNSHNHAYQHKVQPMEQATVHEVRSQRIQEYMEKQEAQEERRQERAKEVNSSSVDGKVNNGYSRGRYPSAKNGDNGTVPNRSEKCIVCGYCGAKNIVPWSGSKKYSCYFCREDI